MKITFIVAGVLLFAAPVQAQSVADQAKEVTAADAVAKLMIVGPDASGSCTQDGQPVPCPAKPATGTTSATITNHAGRCQKRNGNTVCK